MQSEIVSVPSRPFAIRIIENGGSYSAVLVTIADVVVPEGAEHINVFNASSRESALVRAVFNLGRYYHTLGY